MRRVIFVDWHGVLSHQLLWGSILSRPSHPLCYKLQLATEKFFKSDKEQVRSWMRGDLTSGDVIESFHLTLPTRYRPDYLQRALLKGCRKMTPDSYLLDLLQTFRGDCWIVLATDNMECFADNIKSISRLPQSFDYVLCSAQMGVLKSDSVHEFFGPWLRGHQLDFGEAVLIDDSRDTCDEFRRAGGTAILHSDARGTCEELLHALGMDGAGADRSMETTRTS